jgi:hypothetical protein
VYFCDCSKSLLLFLEMQQKSLVNDSSKQVISFNDKSALLAQIRQNLTANKGFGNNLTSSMSTRVGGRSSSTSRNLPPLASNSNLNHFAKQLASLAQKSTVDLLTDVGVGCSQADFEAGNNSGLSPKRTSSLLPNGKPGSLPFILITLYFLSTCIHVMYNVI